MVFQKLINNIAHKDTVGLRRAVRLVLSFSNTVDYSLFMKCPGLWLSRRRSFPYPELPNQFVFGFITAFFIRGLVFS